MSKPNSPRSLGSDEVPSSPPHVSTSQDGDDSDSDEEIPEVCNECESNPVAFFCQECEEWLCSSCTQSQHRSESKKYHQISDVATKKKTKTPHGHDTVRMVSSSGASVPGAREKLEPRSPTNSGGGSSSHSHSSHSGTGGGGGGGGGGGVHPAGEEKDDTLKRLQKTQSGSSTDSRGGAGAGKAKCASKGCMSFSAKGYMCHRHSWKENFQEFAHANPKQFKVAEEIVTTEKTYQEGLYKAVNGFYNRLVVLNEVNRPLLEKAEIAKIFQNIEDIYKLSVKMYEDLTEIMYERVLTQQIGTTLLHYAPQFRIYQGYMEAYEDSIATLGEIRRRNVDFDYFCKWNEKSEGYSIESLLIMPVQRLPRYLLLLDELQRRTPEDDPARIDMKAAAERIKRVTESINKSLHTKDNAGEIRELMARFDKDERFVDLEAPGRRLIVDGPLKKHFSKLSRHLTKTKQYHFFLFNDILVYAAASRTFGGVTFQLKHTLALGDMQVKDLGDKDLLLRSGKGKSISVSCSTMEEKQSWISKIQLAIEEHMASRRDFKVSHFDGGESMVSSKLGKLL